MKYFLITKNPETQAEASRVEYTSLLQISKDLKTTYCSCYNNFLSHENPETNFCGIACDLFDAEFVILPWGPGPFYDNFTFEAIRNPELDPETMCTQFNIQHDFAKATPFDLNQDNEDDDTSDIVIAIRRMVSIEGGVSDEFLKNTINLWAGMVLTTEGFFEGTATEVE
jgi:hypothetical protein